MNMKWSVMLCALLLLPITAHAGHKVCGNKTVSNDTRRCPDGSLPMYVADETRPTPSNQQQPAKPGQAQQPAGQGTAATSESSKTNATGLDYFFGVWRTRIPGAVWTSPSGYQGYDWLHVSAGVSVGDLIIKPDGTYVWNSYGGKQGKWIKGDSASYPIVLIDTVENKQWKVGVDPKHTGGRDIVMWDGKYYYYDGRR